MQVTPTRCGWLDATLVSDAILPYLEHGGEAVVHSIFASVVNLQTPHGLVTIAGPWVDSLPHGLTIRGRIDVRATGLRVGQRAILDRRRVRVPASDIEINLLGAVGWSPRLALTDPQEAARRWRSRAAAVRSLAADLVRQRDGAQDGLGTLIDYDGNGPLYAAARLAAPRLERIADTLRSADPGAAGTAAESIVGLGPGLTPSGDDALVGMAAGVAALATIGTVDAAFLRSAADAAPARTTAVGATFLRHAAAGEFANGLHVLIAALLGPDPAAIAPAIVRTVALGATSGADTLVGVLLGLDALSGIVPERARVAA